MPFPTGITYSGGASYPTGRMNINVFLFDGDSMTASSVPQSIPGSYPVLLSSGTRYSGRASYNNIAVGGRSMGAIYSGYDSSRYYKTNRNNGFLFLWGGTIENSNTTGFLRDYWANARTDGWKIIAFTLHPQSGWTQGFAAYWTGINSFITGNSHLYDYLVRTDLLITNPSDPSIYGDAVHLTISGNEIIANYINTGIDLKI